jgi:hypothetical protein
VGVSPLVFRVSLVVQRRAVALPQVFKFRGELMKDFYQTVIDELEWFIFL